MSHFSQRNVKFLKLGLVASALAASAGVFAADADKGGFLADVFSQAIPALAPVAQQLDRLNGQLGNPVDHAAAAALNSYVPGAGEVLEAGWALQRAGATASSRSPVPGSSSSQVGYQPTQPVMGYQPPAYYGSNGQTNYRAASGYGGQAGYPAYGGQAVYPAYGPAGYSSYAGQAGYSPYGGAQSPMAAPQMPQYAYQRHVGYPQPHYPSYQPDARQSVGYWPADGQQGRVGGVAAPARSTAYGYPASTWPTCGDFVPCSVATTAVQPVQQTIYRGAR